MDLFTYLMAKKGKKSTSHKSDLFAYLLATHRIPLKEATGTNIEINAKSTKLIELTASKLSTQHTTTGKNKFLLPNAEEKNGITYTKNDDGTFNLSGTATANAEFVIYTDTPSWVVQNARFTIKNNLTNDVRYQIATYNGTLPSITWVNTLYDNANTENHFTLSQSTFGTLTRFGIIVPNGTTVNYKNVKLQLETGNTATEWEEYTGGIPAPNPEYPEPINVVDSLSISITNGTDTKTILIDLNDNVIAGIGDYKDILTIDKSGNVTLTKKIGKVVFDGSESWNLYNRVFYLENMPVLLTNGITSLSNYFVSKNNAGNTTEAYSNGNYTICCSNSSYNRIYLRNDDQATTSDLQSWLSTHNTEVYYVLATPETIDLGTVDISLYKGSNTITNSANADMIIKYY